MQKLKTLLYVLLAISLAFTGYLIYDWWLDKSREHVEQSATIILNKIQKVAKLTVVEGSFSEIYEKSSFKYFDIQPFQKKVLVRVHAKVSAGYDFERLSLQVDSMTKTIWINDLPVPQILSIDHDLDYYDITEGLFVSFNAAEYNLIQTEAKELIRKKASESNLLSEADVQGKDLIDMIRLIVESSGWNLKIRSRPLLQN